MVKVLQIVEIVATIALSLGFSCLGLLALARFAFDLAQVVRGELFFPPPRDDDAPPRVWARERLKIVVRLLALAAASALLFWLSYALARMAMAPIR